jgi:hypothetical protein
LSRTYTPATNNSIGLWSAQRAADEEVTEPVDDMFLNFGDDGSTQSPPSKTQDITMETAQLEEDDVPPLGGLWGMPRPPGKAERIREMAPKRRWTVNEPGMA